jgi:hypothetical protein
MELYIILRLFSGQRMVLIPTATEIGGLQVVVVVLT